MYKLRPTNSYLVSSSNIFHYCGAHVITFVLRIGLNVTSDGSTKLYITFVQANVCDFSCISIDDDGVPEAAIQVIAPPVLNCPHCDFKSVHSFCLQRHIRVIMSVTYVETDK